MMKVFGVCECMCVSVQPSLLLTKRYNNRTYDAVSQNDSEHTKGPAIHGSIFKLIGLVL